MRRLLVDTHTLLWWLSDDPALSLAAREAIGEPANELLVSAVSLWEMAIKRSLGKLRVPDDLPAQIQGQGFGWLPVTFEHAWAVRDLPLHHRDPFDRLLVAQSVLERTPIITADPSFGAYGVDVRW